MTRRHLGLHEIPTCPDCGGHWLDDAPTSHVGSWECWLGDESVLVCERHLQERIANGWRVREVTAFIHADNCGISREESCSRECFNLSNVLEPFKVKYPPLPRIFIPTFKGPTFVCDLASYNIFGARYLLTEYRDDHLL